MGTAPSSILHKIPESAPVRGQKDTPDPERSEKKDASRPAKEAGSEAKTRSGKSSAHKKSSFAAIFRGALQSRSAPIPDGENPEETRPGKGTGKNFRGDHPRTSGQSRKKKATPSEGALLSLAMPIPEPSPKKKASLSRPSPAEPSRSSRILWGPQGHSPSHPSSQLTVVGKRPPLPEALPTPFPKSADPSGALFSGEAIKPLAPSMPEMRSSPVPKESKALSSEKTVLIPDEADLSPGRPPLEKMSLPERSSFQREDPSLGKEVSADSKPSPFPHPDKSLEKIALHGKEGGSPALQTSSPGVLDGSTVGGPAPGEETTQSPAIPDGMSARVGQLAREGGGRVALEVKPPHLGPVGVRVHVDPHTRLVTVELSSHDPRIRHLLSEKEGSIKESLSQTGFVLDRFQVVSQSPPGLGDASLQGLSAAGSGGGAAGGDGASSGGNRDDGVAGGSSQGADLASQGRPEAGASGREGGRGTFSGASPGADEGVSAVGGNQGEAPAASGESVKNAGYHRIA